MVGVLTTSEPPVLVMLGPTASGKSDAAIEVAARLGGEIVNADSMLVYRGMDIGTAKPTLEERHGVPHHLIDVLDITQTATVADFQVMARSAIVDCRTRGVVPVLVGGSALYLRAIVDDFTFPGTDPRVRAALEAELAAVGPAALHARLVALAPAAAAEIQSGNGRRIVRALEVVELTGDYTASLPEPTYALGGVVQVGLSIERPVMDDRIERRVDVMWERGFVDEVERLEGQGLRRGVTASRALGYRQILAYLDGGTTEAEARRATVAGTRRFARKQLGWWRRDPRILWLDTRDHLVERIVSLLDD